MCSAEVFFGVWLVILISVSSTCSGVAPIKRANCVSVLILLGIKLRRPMRKGRMSWRKADASVISITPSCSRVWRAGRSLGIRIGMGGFVGLIDEAGNEVQEVALGADIGDVLHSDGVAEVIGD